MTAGRGRTEKSKGGRAPLEIEATIDELAPGGAGVALATLEGERRAIFVRSVARGDRVRLAVDLASRPARGKVLAIVEASVDRVDPACPWVERALGDAAHACGGCDWMHLTGDAQRTAHEVHLRAALPEVWRGTPIRVHAAKDPLGYRTRARLHARASGGRAIVGMHEARTREPVEVDRCAVLHPDLEAARARLASLLDGAHGRGDIQLALGILAKPRPAVLDLHWSGVLAGAVFARLERAVADGWLAGARVTAGETRIPAKIGDPAPWILGGDGAPLQLAAGGFGQASDAGNAALAARVAELARIACTTRGEPRELRVLELYAGAGNFTVLLAPLASTKVTAVESEREACEAARANLAARELGSRAKVVEADASAYALPPQTHLVVLDPPRTGAREACARIAASSVKHVLYVSCDTQTLARDLALLASSQTPAPFVPRAVEAFELFPQTSHAEAIVHLERAGRGERP